MTLGKLGMRDLIDVLLVAYVIYRIMLIISGTRAVQLLKGLIIIFVADAASNLLGLRAVHWLFQKFIPVVLVALPIVFLPELRRALEQLGRGEFLNTPFFFRTEDVTHAIDEVVQAVEVFSREKTGALIIFEHETGLNNYIETGIRMDSHISAELLANLFVINSPLHDGAVILRGDRIAAAGCILPLTDNPNLSPKLGMRHRAALGLSEQSDAIAIVVSEETGVISMATDGKLIRYLDPRGLRERMIAIFNPKPSRRIPWQSKGTSRNPE
jgi:diadenylate cyclase